jgi:hypothetical protein
MRPGPNSLNTSTILPELLAQVAIGQDSRFREYLQKNDCRNLNLAAKLMKFSAPALGALGKALNKMKVTAIDLSGNNIDDAKIKYFSQALQETQLRAIHLSDNLISDTGAGILGRALVGTGVKKLNLSYNDIGVCGASELGAALANSSITSIDLSNNNLGNIGAIILGMHLKNSSVSKLNLSNNNLSDTLLSTFGSTLQGTQVYCLNLSQNNINSKGMQNLVRVLPETQIKKLNLENNLITDTGVQALAKVLNQTQIIQLKLASNQISAAALQQINDRIVEQQKSISMGLYHITCLRLMPKAVQAQNFNLPELTTTSVENSALQVAGGILMQAKLPNEIFCHIVSYLPFMKTATGKNQVQHYAALANQRYPNGLQYEDEAKDKSVFLANKQP